MLRIEWLLKNRSKLWICLKIFIKLLKLRQRRKNVHLVIAQQFESNKKICDHLVSNMQIFIVGWRFSRKGSNENVYFRQHTSAHSAISSQLQKKGMPQACRNTRWHQCDPCDTNNINNCWSAMLQENGKWSKVINSVFVWSWCCSIVAQKQQFWFWK